MPTVATPSRKQNSSKNNPVNKLPVFLLSLLEIIIAASGAGMLFLLVALFNHSVSAVAFNLAASAGIGILSGLYTRSLFAKSIPFMRWMVSLLATLLGLIAFNLTSRWIYGIAIPTISIPDWLMLVQAILGAITGWMTLIAWQKSRLAQLRQSARQRKIKRTRIKREKLNTQRKAASARSKKAKPARTAPRRSKKIVPARTSKTRTVAQATLKPSTAETRLKLGRKSRNKQVTLGGRVEHRCPFCLEPVLQQDPRGVKTCSVCGAWHHQDCWDITGHCQVPHRGNGA